ncbi:MAG: hypothetical protein E7387_05570 [Ruminococcaceae bacterium]|nr:hypothetical protein [Oscillospiraceae bacterium]
MNRVKNHRVSPGKVRKFTALYVLLILLFTVTVVGTVSFIIVSEGPISNLFNPSEVTTEVEETLDGNTKKNVSIKNTGDTTAWIRAAVIVTWQDADGNVYGQAPVAGTDYAININVADENGWLKGEDGFYYWYMPVKSIQEDVNNCNTGILINECSYVANAPEGYYLNVEIIGSGLQSKPDSMFSEEWEPSSGLHIDEGKLVQKAE